MSADGGQNGLPKPAHRLARLSSYAHMVRRWPWKKFWAATYLAFLVVCAVCFVFDVVGYVTLEHRICPGAADIAAPQNSICQDPNKDGYIACHPRPTGCEGRYARFVNGIAHFDDIVIPQNILKVSGWGLIRLAFLFIVASAVNAWTFFWYVMYQPWPQNPLFALVLWKGGAFVYRKARETDQTAGNNPIQTLLDFNAADNAGPALPDQIHRALSAKETTDEPEFDD